jgi:hypothetical protein
MNLHITNEANEDGKNYIRNKMFEFNSMHFPDRCYLHPSIRMQPGNN